MHDLVERELWVHAKIRVHSGKTHVWNRSGRVPPTCDELQRRTVLQDPTAQVWTGSLVSTQNQGIKVLGCPLGHEDFVTTQLDAMYNQLGCSCSIVLRPDEISTCAWSDQIWRSILHEGTMPVCGIVSPESCACLRSSVMTWPVLPQLCRSLSEGWV